MKKIIYIDDITSFPREYPLSAERKKRCAVLDSPAEKQKFICAESFTCMALENYCDIKNPVLTGQAGKPLKVKDFPLLHLSRSYAGNSLALFLNTDEPSGIDCEKILEADFNVIKYFFTEEEKEYVKKHKNKTYAFTLLWTRKEACIKCTDKGLNYPFHRLNTVPDTEEELTGRCSGFSVKSYVKGNMILSAASESADDFPLFIEYEV